MPYADPDVRREYDRSYKRAARAGERPTPGPTQLPLPLRLKTAQDVLDLLAEQVQHVREDPEAGTLERARCIGYLAGVSLKAVELVDLAARLEALERALQGRKEEGV